MKSDAYMKLKEIRIELANFLSSDELGLELKEVLEILKRLDRYIYKLEAELTPEDVLQLTIKDIESKFNLEVHIIRKEEK